MRLARYSKLERRHFPNIYLFLLPTLILFVMFYLYPIIQVLFTAFTSWDGFNAPKFDIANPFVNFNRLFKMRGFMPSLRNWMHNYIRIARQYKEFGRIPGDAWVRRQLRIPQTEDKLQLLRSLGIRYVPGSEIRERRKGFSRREIALKLGVSGGTLALWENAMVPEYIVWEIMDIIRKMQELYRWKNVYFVHNGVEYAGTGNGRTLIVREGTRINPEVTESFRKTRSAALRRKLTQEGIIEDNEFTINYEFVSPVDAAAVLSGCVISCRNTWHDRAGRDWYTIWPERAWKT